MWSACDTEHASEPLPSIFILLSGKSKTSYRDAFQYMKNRFIELGCDPSQKNVKERNAQFDHEKSERDEFAKAMSIDKIKGCFMQLSGNFRKNLITKGLKDCIYDEEKKR